MKLKLGLLLLILMIIPFVFAEEECQRNQNSRDVPCILTSTFDYTPPCNGSVANIYLENGSFIQNLTFTDVGDTSRCQITWNISSLGSYIFTVANGDSGNITIKKEDNVMIGIMIGLAIIILYFSIMGFVNTNPSLRFVSLFLSFIEVLIAIFILYAHEANGNYTNILLINFYVMALLGFGLFVLSWIDWSFRIVDFDDDLSQQKGSVKWK